MKKEFCLIIAMAVAIISCDKKENEFEPASNNIVSDNNAPLIYKSFFPLKSGNYWIYTIYEIDENGNENPLNRNDSIWISNDTMLAGRLYYEVNIPEVPGSVMSNKHYFRDSLHYLVTSTGFFRYSSENFMDTLQTKYLFISDSVYLYLGYKMCEKGNVAHVPAGDFSTINFKSKVIYSDSFPTVPKVRYQDRCYAENVGLIKENIFFASSPKKLERRLLRYHIAE